MTPWGIIIAHDDFEGSLKRPLMICHLINID
jgi:hypothetical protein